MKLKIILKGAKNLIWLSFPDSGGRVCRSVRRSVTVIIGGAGANVSLQQLEALPELTNPSVFLSSLSGGNAVVSFAWLHSEI